MLESVACYHHSPKVYDIFGQTSSIRAYGHDSYGVLYLCKQKIHVQSHVENYKVYHRSFAFINSFEGRKLLAPSISGWRCLSFSNNNRPQTRGEGFRTYAAAEVAGAVDVINDLGLDTLTFLAVTVIVVPAFKIARASPILGFFFAGIVLNQLGIIRNLTDVKVLSEWGILFLLFEMGLELSLARLKALAKFAFGMGLTQVVLSTLAFTAFELPPNGAVGTRILEFLFHSRSDLVNIRSIDEAVVIGAALSLSSSAFVLQLLAEKGELPTRFGSATLGILLLQDIAVVPLLVILPVLESQVSERFFFPRKKLNLYQQGRRQHSDSLGALEKIIVIHWGL